MNIGSYIEDLVSVIMPAFNAESYIEEAIKSVLNQKYQNLELIIINDGSNDNTNAIIIKYINDLRIKYISYTTNQGKNHAINLGLQLAKGEYICFFAADDVMPYDSISLRVDHLKKNNLDAVFGSLILCDAKLKKIKKYEITNKSVEIFNFENSLNKIVFNNFISGGTLLLNRKLLSLFMPLPESLKFEDWWISFCLIINHINIGYINYPLIYYRLHGKNDNGCVNPNYKSVLKDYKRHLEYYNELLKKLSDVDISFKERYLINKMILLAAEAKKKCINGKIYHDVYRFIKYFGIKKYIFINLVAIKLYG